MDSGNYCREIVGKCDVKIEAGEGKEFLLKAPCGPRTSFEDMADMASSIKNAPGIHLCHILETLDSGKKLINFCFDALATGGFLVITSAHQYLAERKELPPSRFSSKNRRFFTPALLLSEIEEALVPNSYRVRHCGDDDSGYDYTSGKSDEVKGDAGICLVLEKMTPPSWTVQEPEFANDQVKIESYGFFEYNRPPLSKHRERILIIKVDHRGDFLIAIPVLQMIRAIKPTAEITLVVSSWNVEVARGLDYIDRIVVFDYFAENPSLDEGKVKPLIIEELKNEIFDLAIDLRIDLDTRILLKNIQASIKAGISEIDQNSYLNLKIKPFHISLPGQSQEEIVVKKRAGESLHLMPNKRVDLAENDVVEYEISVDGLATQMSSDWEVAFHFSVKNRTWFQTLRPSYRLFVIKDGEELPLFEGEVPPVRIRKWSSVNKKIPLKDMLIGNEERSLIIKLRVELGGSKGRVALHKMGLWGDSAKSLKNVAGLNIKIHEHYQHNCEQLTALASIALMRLTRGTAQLTLSVP